MYHKVLYYRYVYPFLFSGKLSADLVKQRHFPLSFYPQIAICADKTFMKYLLIKHGFLQLIPEIEAFLSYMKDNSSVRYQPGSFVIGHFKD